jgi:hypothetical protein
LYIGVAFPSGNNQCCQVLEKDVHASLLSWKVLVCDWPHFVWKKSLVCKDAVLQGIPLFRSVSEDSAVRKVGSLPAVRTTCHPVWTLIYPLFHPSGRRPILFGRPDRPSIIRPDDVDFRLDPSLHREASVPACIRPDVSAARPDDVQ